MCAMLQRIGKKRNRRQVRTLFSGTLRNRRGASLLELALLLPILVVLLFGIIDLGRLIHARLVITNVSREGASLACRDINSGANLISLLQTSATPFNLQGQGQIFITNIGAARVAPAPPHANPWIISRDQGGSLSVSSSIVGAVNGNLQSGLSQTMMNHLTLGAGNTPPHITGVTVVEVFYRYMPITPLPNFLQGVFNSGGGILIGSRSVFPSSGG
jgi:hypothetical protein